jgi:hypothetical protein
MSNLTYLNEASVLHNLKARYQAKLIYVSIMARSTGFLQTLLWAASQSPQINQ